MLRGTRDIKADKQLLKIAKSYVGVYEVRIIGINSLGVVHQAREDIKGLMEAGIKIKILLLNPKSNAFIERIKEVECKCQGIIEDFESHRQRLLAEWNSTIMILRSIVTNIKNSKILEVKVRNEKPTHAFTSTISKDEKECFAWINEYPPEGRGTRGKQFLCAKYVDSQKYTFCKYMETFEKVWNDKKTEYVDIYNNTWILSQAL